MKDQTATATGAFPFIRERFKRPDRAKLLNERDYFFNDYEIFHRTKTILKDKVVPEGLDGKISPVQVPEPWFKEGYFSRKDKGNLLIVALIDLSCISLFIFLFFMPFEPISMVIATGLLVFTLWQTWEMLVSAPSEERSLLNEKESLDLLYHSKDKSKEDIKEIIDSFFESREEFLKDTSDKDNSRIFREASMEVLGLVQSNYLDYFTERHY